MIVAQGAQRGSFAGPPCATSVEPAVPGAPAPTVLDVSGDVGASPAVPPSALRAAPEVVRRKRYLKEVSMDASLERSALARLPHSRRALPRTGNHTLCGIAVRLAAPTIALGVPGAMPRTTGTVDHQDLAVLGGLNVGVVALFFPALRVFSQGRAASLFLTYPGSGQARSASRCWWRRLPLLNRRPTARGSHQAPVLLPDRAGRRRVGSRACAGAAPSAGPISGAFPSAASPIPR